MNVTFGESTLTRLALLLPKLMTLEPPPCIWFMMKIQNPMMSMIGRMNEGARPPRRLGARGVVGDVVLVEERRGRGRVGVADGVLRLLAGRPP